MKTMKAQFSTGMSNKTTNSSGEANSMCRFSTETAYCWEMWWALCDASGGKSRKILLRNH